MNEMPSALAKTSLLERALETPVILAPPPPQYDYDRLDYGMTIGIERTPGGRLWACWVGGGDSDKGFFVLASSDDDGESWSPPRMVIDPHSPDLPHPRRTLVGALWTDPQGRLWLFFDQSLGYFDGRGGDWYTRCDHPDAQAPTWSRPVRIWHGCTLNKPAVLRDGTWLLPVSLWDRSRVFGAFEGCFGELDSLRGAHVLASEDGGFTWEDRAKVSFPYPQFDEHHVIERRDGSLWMTARTARGLYESTSADGGRTWTAPVASAIGQVVARAAWDQAGSSSSRHHLRRLRSGRLLLIKHGQRIDQAPDTRSHLCAFLSDDDGKSWKGSLLLDERFEVSYPDSAQGEDGMIYASYDRNRATDGQVLLARFTEEDVLAGGCCGPRSRLRMLISRPGAKR